MKAATLADSKRWWLQRPGREKLLLGACSLGVVLALGDSLALSPVEKRLKQARSSEEQLQAKWDQLQSRRKGQTAQAQELQEQEQALRARLHNAQTRLGALNSQLSDTALIPDVLRTVVATMGSTRLLELSFTDDSANPAGAPGAANASTTKADPAASASTAPRRIYRLPVTLKVSGSWPELSGVLTQIETRAPALQWQTMTLDSTEWPAIQLTLRAHVRSLQPRWGAGS